MQVLTIQEHIKKRSMWLGSKNLITKSIITQNNDKLSQQELSYIPLVVSSFEEIFMNALDQYSRFPKEVNIIVVSINQNGQISVKNTGPGIPIEHNGKQDNVTICCYQPFSGTNFDDENRITGGMNGCGMKLVNYNSSKFIIETVDKNLLFKQEFMDGANIIGDSQITDYKQQSYTKISFDINVNGINPILQNLETYYNIFKARCILTSLNFIGKNVTICFESEIEQCNYKYSNIQQFYYNHVVNCTVPKNNTDVSVIKSLANIKNKNIQLHIFNNNDSSLRQLCLINGLVVQTGAHITLIYKSIIQALIKKNKNLETQLKNSILKNHILILGSVTITNPEFSDQTKKQIEINKTQLQSLQLNDIKFDTIAIDFLIQQILQTSFKSQKKIASKTLSKQIDKYQRALKCGGSQSLKCTLFIAEGDSAMSMIKEGIRSSLNNDYYGIFSLQGVIVNSRKQVTNYGEQLSCSKMLQDNKVLSNLEKILGLKRGTHYTSLNQLSYGSITVLVDQDSDGVGNIFGLLLSHMHLFWKELFELGFVFRLNTPIIRAFLKKKQSKYITFYSKEEYNRWTQTQQVNNYDIKYYKGLAGHYGKFVTDIFEKYNQNRIQYTLDDFSNEKFEAYFGENVLLRKTELRIPLQYKNLYDQTNNVSVTDHLDVETKTFQLENIERKLPSSIDGLMLTRRKILYGSILYWNNNSSELKVFQLGGEVARKTFYHHGEATLQGTIICMAQSFYGSHIYPYFHALGQFGTRHFGGSDSGQARYISVQLNKEFVQLLFPANDLPELDYRTEDGIVVEPMYFVPIIPTILIDNYDIPATGWCVRMQARSFCDVIYTILKLLDVCSNNLEYDSNELQNQLTRDLIPHKDPNYKIINGIEYTIGAYKILPKKKYESIEVTELPKGLWTNSFIMKIRDKKEIYDVIDKSGADTIQIQILFNEPIQQIEEKNRKNGMNGIIVFLGMYKKVQHNINCISSTGTVLSCNRYIDLIPEWFAKRSILYQQRHNKLLFVAQMKLVLLNNRHRYLTSFSIDENMKIKQIIEHLSKDNYIQLNETAIKFHYKYSYLELQKILKQNVSFDYLLDMKIKDKSIESVTILAKKIKQLEEKIIVLKNISSKELWFNELLSLQTYVHQYFKY